MSVVGALNALYTQGVAMPGAGQNGFISVAIVNGTTVAIGYINPTLLFEQPAKLGADLADGNATIQVSQGNRRLLPLATLTANRQVTLATTGATAGEVIVIDRRDVNAFTLAVVNGGAGAGTKYTFPASVARVAVFVFDGTNWALQQHWAT
jgi:hypothetical protein